MNGPYSVYLHIPFCTHRCSYCDFNTYAGQEGFIPAYVDALVREIRGTSLSAGVRLPVHSVFFGGGTPSLMNGEQVGRVLSAIAEGFELQEGVEISLEANPGTLNLDGLQTLRKLGVNRLSMGMQSAHPDDLRLLERQHDPYYVIQAVSWARRAGFDNLSVDLMFGLPEQDLQRWEKTLEFAVRLETEHLSLYGLTFEHGTPFGHWMEKGLIPLVDGDLAADMYELAEDKLSTAGFLNYEISNWARSRKPDGLLSCRHNMQYWLNQPYFGFGAGAHGYIDGTRTVNVAPIRAYIQRMQAGWNTLYPATPASITSQPVSRQDEINETMMVGLRLTQSGVSRVAFKKRFKLNLEDHYGAEIEECQRFGLLEWSNPQKDALRLTGRGRLLGNQVFRRFLK